MLPPLRRPAPHHVYVLLQGGWSFLWATAFTLSLVYQVESVGLTPLQLIVVGTVLEATCFLAEVPTGVIADRRSRRLSVLIGLATMGVGIAVFAVPWFWTILLAQVIWGVGYTFVSGAAEAWVTDEVGEDRIQPVFTRGHQVSLAANIVGIVTAGLLGSVWLGLPTLIGGVGFLLLAAAMVVLMREDNFTPAGDDGREGWRALWSSFRAALTDAARHRVVRTFLAVGLLAGLTGEVFDRLWVDHLLNGVGLPSFWGIDDAATWFTLFALLSAAVGLLSSLVANRLAARTLNTERPSALLAGLIAVQVGGTVVFALSATLVPALAGRWVRDAAVSVSWPVTRAWLNRSIPSSATRATSLSIMGQADAVGQVAGGPAFGLYANRFGVQAAMLLAAAVQAPAMWLFARLGR